MPQSNTSLSPAPIKTPILDGNGGITTPWILWFQSLLQRVGGATATPLNEIASQVTGAVSSIATLQAGQTTQDASIADLQDSRTADEARIKALEDETAGTANTWVPSFTGMATTGMTACLGWYTIVGGQLFWEVLVDAASGSITFASAKLTNMPKTTARPGVFTAINLTAYADFGNGSVDGDVATLPNFTLTGQIAVLAGRYAI